MKQTKYCPKCDKALPVENFHKNRTRCDGLHPWCKTCSKLSKRAYHLTDKGRLALREQRKRYLSKPEVKKQRCMSDSIYRKKHRREYSCSKVVENALKTGKLLRPKNCSNCGCTHRLHGHHPDYNKPLWVEWLCCSCHRFLHLEKLTV